MPHTSLKASVSGASFLGSPHLAYFPPSSLLSNLKPPEGFPKPKVSRYLLRTETSSSKDHWPAQLTAKPSGGSSVRFRILHPYYLQNVSDVKGPVKGRHQLPTFQSSNPDLSTPQSSELPTPSLPTFNLQFSIFNRQTFNLQPPSIAPTDDPHTPPGIEAAAGRRYGP
jgi:hypothetical protein